MFAGLISYLLQENKREGYPLLSDKSPRGDKHLGYPAMPPPKVFLTKHNGRILAPRPEVDAGPIAAVPAASFPGAPLVPTGSAMRDGVGAAAYAMRADAPDLDWHDGNPRIIPLRLLPDFYLDAADPDPRGMVVVGADKLRAGVVRDVWIDRSEVFARYLEVDVDANGRRVLAPMTLAVIDRKQRRVAFKSVLAADFADVPATASPEAVTLREEDRISAYFAGGQLHATAARSEPLI